jgi:hypothetical protein
MEMQTTKSHQAPSSPTQALERAAKPPEEEKGAIGIAFLVWLFGGGLGLAILVFVMLKMC